MNTNVYLFRRKENQGNTNLFQRSLNRFCIVEKAIVYDDRIMVEFKSGLYIEANLQVSIKIIVMCN